MAITADLITHRKLVLTKQLFQHAINQTEQYGAPARILALICFDLTSETLIKTLIGSLDSSKGPVDNFGGLLKQADDLLAAKGLGSLPNKSTIQHVHSLRNDAQHKAKYPNEIDVSDARTYCRDFLFAVCSLVWNLNFETISLVDLIQHPEVKKYLTDAEAALAACDFETAVAQAAAGLFFSLGSVESVVVGRLPNLSSFMGSFDNSRADAAYRDVKNVLERMQRSLVCVALGVKLCGIHKD